MLKEEGDLIRKCKAMHEDDILSCWLREDTEGNVEEVGDMKRRLGKKGA